MNILSVPFIGLYELRKHLPDLLSRLQKHDGEAVITQQGKPAAMLLSIKRYVEMNILNEELEDAVKELSDKKYIVSLTQDVEDAKKGKGKSAKTLFKELNV